MHWRWRPADVWALSLREFCMYVDILDQLIERDKKQAQRKPARGRRRGR